MLGGRRSCGHPELGLARVRPLPSLLGRSRLWPCRPTAFFLQLIVSLSVAVWLLERGGRSGCRKTSGRHSRCGRSRVVLEGFGFFLTGLWWLGLAFLVEADRFGLGYAAGRGSAFRQLLALFFASVRCGASDLECERVAHPRPCFRIGAWRNGCGAISSPGFPGTASAWRWDSSSGRCRSRPLIGLWGMTVWSSPSRRGPATLATGATLRARLTPSLIALAGLIAVTGYGAMRVPATPSPLVADVRLRIMQPNLPQDEKFNPANREEIMARYLRLSDRATSPQTSGITESRI